MNDAGIKKRFDNDTTRELLKIKCRDWKIDKISRNIKYIIGPDPIKLNTAK